MSNPYFTLEEVSSHFRVSKSTVRSWMRTGVIPEEACIKVGRVHRFDIDKIEAKLRAETEAQSSETQTTAQEDSDVDPRSFYKPKH